MRRPGIKASAKKKEKTYCITRTDSLLTKVCQCTEAITHRNVCQEKIDFSRGVGRRWPSSTPAAIGKARIFAKRRTTQVTSKGKSEPDKAESRKLRVLTPEKRKMKEAILLGIVQLLGAHAAILPPPWADPERNPCASQPGGWLLVHWPPDGKCYRIFHRGYPCPETMELNPVQDDSDRITAECRCPPRTAQIATSDICYPIHAQGPCQRGEYFAPLRLSPPARQRIGHCTKVKECGPEEAFWPATDQCYERFTKGPCPDGQLLVLNEDTRLGECDCSGEGALAKYYWSPTKTCHEHYARGPCLERGTLFLPGPRCGCSQILPNYDPETKQCYEIGTMGPCKAGHRFDVQPPKSKATCMCKPEHVPWEDGQCYRLYTRGPCPPGQIIFANRTCGQNPCPKGKLYFPENGSCHRVGVRGPCAKGQLVLFERSIRPSVEGISHRGMCGCSGPEKCKTEERLEEEKVEPESRSTINDVAKEESNAKNARNGHQYLNDVAHKIRICEKQEKPIADDCHALYSQGPCSQGEWLVPARQGRTERQYHRFGWADADPTLLHDDSAKLKARCECRPGYGKSSLGDGCRLPLVSLAKFLNGDDLFS